MKYTIIAAAAAMVMAGCSRSYEQDAAEIKTLRKDCIETRSVMVYHQDASSYWTEQRQRFCMAAILFEAWGTEPEGSYRVTYQKGQFSRSGTFGPAMQALPAGLMNGPLAELVYYAFTAGAGFLPAGMVAGEEARIEGQRYESFLTKGGSGRTVTLYKNAVSGRMELVRVTDGAALDWMSRSYDPRYHSRFERMIPRKLDVFDIRPGIAAKKLLIQIEYIDVQ